MSDHLIAEPNRHAKALSKMTLPTTKPNDRDLAWYIAECIDLKKQLEMECAAKREHLRIACAEINELKVKVGFIKRENAALLKDVCDLVHKNELLRAALTNVTDEAQILVRIIQANTDGAGVCKLHRDMTIGTRAAIDAAREEGAK